MKQIALKSMASFFFVIAALSTTRAIAKVQNSFKVICNGFLIDQETQKVDSNFQAPALQKDGKIFRVRGRLDDDFANLESKFFSVRHNIYTEVQAHCQLGLNFRLNHLKDQDKYYQNLMVKPEKSDRYGNTLAYVQFPNGELIELTSHKFTNVENINR